MKMVDHRFTLIIIGVMALVWGCAAGPRKMMPTPNVYLNEAHDPYHALNPDLKSTQVRLFYVTDRAPEQDKAGNLRYGYGRSASLAFVDTVVDLGDNFTWEDLLQASRTQKRLKPVKLTLGKITEHIRGPKTPLPYAMVDGKIVEEPSWVAQSKQAAEAFRKELVQQLELTPRKEVFLYVHGFHNTFDDAAFAMAELWHFLGRIGVPMIYTWPAGFPGLFGYTYDRESSEFTVFHLRRVLKFIAGFPEVDKIHVIAHSRGTDVAVAALRELTIEMRAAGLDPQQELKLHNFILAAPDIDLQVAVQRVSGDHLPLSAKRFTVYTSPDDKAIGVARKLFQSPRGRVGTYGPESIDDYLKVGAEFGKDNYFIVRFEGASGGFVDVGDKYGHSYFRNAPTVSSDVVLMLRDDLDPGTPERPLEHIDLNFWRIPQGYPALNPAQ
jgi:esterase/lipase superfamily enzyme